MTLNHITFEPNKIPTTSSPVNPSTYVMDLTKEVQYLAKSYQIKAENYDLVRKCLWGLTVVIGTAILVSLLVGFTLSAAGQNVPIGLYIALLPLFSLGAASPYLALASKCLRNWNKMKASELESTQFTSLLETLSPPNNIFLDANKRIALIERAYTIFSNEKEITKKRYLL